MKSLLVKFWLSTPMKNLSGSSKLGHVVFWRMDLIGRFSFKETEVLPLDVLCFFLSFLLEWAVL